MVRLVRRALGAVLGMGLLAAGCAPADPRDPQPASETPAPRQAPRPRIVMLGDSLTAGYGLERRQAYPALIQGRLDAEGYDYEVVNAGLSGDTSAGGRRRLEWVLEGPVAILVVALGGNDGLRGLPVEQLRDNLEHIVTSARRRGIRVLLAGMEAPANLGANYTAAFREAFQNVAREHDVAFLPFLLDGVVGRVELNQADAIHPNARGAARLAANLWPLLEPLLAGPSPGEAP